MGYHGTAKVTPDLLVRDEKRRHHAKVMLCSLSGNLLKKNIYTSMAIAFNQRDIEEGYRTCKELLDVDIISDDKSALLVQGFHPKRYNLNRHVETAVHIYGIASIWQHKYLMMVRKYHGRLIYSDVDSITFSISKNISMIPGFPISEIIGEFKFQYYPNIPISFICLGVKSYSVVLKSPSNIIFEQIKCKGFNLHPAELSNIISNESYRDKISEFLTKVTKIIRVPQKRQKTDLEGNHFTQVILFTLSFKENGSRFINTKCGRLTTHPYGMVTKDMIPSNKKKPKK